MGFTVIISLIVSVLILSNFLFIILYFKKPKKEVSYDNLELLSDLINNNKAIIEVRRIAPGRLFLRSPRDLG